jgi:hypothetical protein
MTIANQVRIARAALLKRWLLELDPANIGAPNDLSFREIHIALNQIERRVAECRELYPFTPPADDTEAIIRSLPSHLRDDDGYARPQAARAYREVSEAPATPKSSVDISA